MKVFFHGTSSKNVTNILKNGLDPSHSSYADEEKKYFPRGKIHYFVYLAHSYATASAYGTVLEVCVPAYMRRKFNYRRGEFVRAPMRIPPEYIRLAKVSVYTAKEK